MFLGEFFRGFQRFFHVFSRVFPSKGRANHQAVGGGVVGGVGVCDFLVGSFFKWILGRNLEVVWAGL